MSCSISARSCLVSCRDVGKGIANREHCLFSVRTTPRPKGKHGPETISPATPFRRGVFSLGELDSRARVALMSLHPLSRCDSGRPCVMIDGLHNPAGWICQGFWNTFYAAMRTEVSARWGPKEQKNRKCIIRLRESNCATVRYRTIVCMEYYVNKINMKSRIVLSW